MTATIYNFAEERARREAAKLREGEDHTARIFQNLERGSDLHHVDDATLVRWAHMLADAPDDKTIEDVCLEVEKMVAEGKACTS